MHTAVDVV